MSEIAISVIMPCYKKFSDFCVAFPHNHLCFDPRVEVVLVLDEPSEEQLYLGMIRGFWRNHSKFRLIVNDEPHEWRPPCKPINVGIRNSLGEYCIVQSPESIVMESRPGYIFQKIHDEKFRKFYLTGMMAHIPKAEVCSDFRDQWWPKFEGKMKTADEYGFILFSKQEAMNIGGYDERRTGYGCDDNDIRARLQKNKNKHVNSSKIRVAHIWTEAPWRREGSHAEAWGEEIILPDHEKMGMSFGRVAFDWRKKL